MRRLVTALLLAGTFAIPAAAEYPDKPIRLIVPQAAGSATDTVARILGAELGKELGQQIIVDNRAGGALTIGLDITAKSEPDGYTICMGPIGAVAITRHMVAKLPYDIERDFQPIALVARGHMLLAVAPDAPFKTVPELIDYAKKNPGKLNYGSSGTGSPHHLAGELLHQKTGIDIAHIPYKGGGAAVNDLIGGHIGMAFLSLSAAVPHMNTGKIRIIAMVEKTRYAALPDIPTIGETVPGFEMSSWVGVFAPAGTPADIVAKLNDGIAKVLTAEAVKAKLAALGLVVVAGKPEELAQVVKEGLRVRGELVKAAGIQPE